MIVAMHELKPVQNCPLQTKPLYIVLKHLLQGI
jgi:hypothetical protein